jgi:hypothetical protein
MSSSRIVIASVLKPLYEPRMYEKIGISLSEIPNTEVHVVGYGTADPHRISSVVAHGLGSFPRLSFSRLIAPWKVFLKVLQLRPHLLIACTHELLLPFVLYKLISPRTPLVYDLQENYVLNILHTEAFPRFLRYPIAGLVRLHERFCLPFYKRVISAEDCYLKEMPFIRSKAVVIANKALRLDNTMRKTPSERIILLYSGSISREYGIYEAIQLVERLHSFDPSFELRIVGYCADAGEAHRLRAFIKNIPYIQADNFDRPVPHEHILKAIAQADWGLICYRDNVATNATWSTLVQTYDAGMSISYDNPALDSLIPRLKKPSFYHNTNATEELFWETEALKLKASIAGLIKN